MSARYDASCQGKRSFLRWSDASQRAARMTRRDEGRINAYRCRLCGAYHLGNANEVFASRTADFKRRKQDLAQMEIDE